MENINLSTNTRPWLVHWSKGQFLRQQFFQQWQQGLLEHVAGHASLVAPFSHGLLQPPAFSTTELLKHRLAVESLDAILPGGTRVLVPRDTVVAPLDFQEAYLKSADSLDVSVVVPRWQPGQANVANNQSDAFRQRARYRVVRQRCVDDGLGTGEVDVEFRCLNARLELTAKVDRDQYDSMVVCRLIHGTQNQPALDLAFTPPAIRLSALPGTENLLRALIAEVRAVIQQLTARLSPERFSWASVSPVQHENLQRLRILARYHAILRAHLPELEADSRSSRSHPGWPPFHAHLALAELLAELAALGPGWVDPEPFDHERPGPGIRDLVQEVRSRLSPRHIRVPGRKDFTAMAKGDYKLALALDDVTRPERWYLGLRAGTGMRLESLIKSLEDRGNFRLLARSQTQQVSNKRNEGLKLVFRRPEETTDFACEPGMGLFEIVTENTEDAKLNREKWEHVIKGDSVGVRELCLQWDESKIPLNPLNVVLYMIYPETGSPTN